MLRPRRVCLQHSVPEFARPRLGAHVAPLSSKLQMAITVLGNSSNQFDPASTCPQVRIPEHLVLPALHKLQKSHGYDPDRLAWIYTVVLSTLMGTLAGVVQSIMGSPGDLPETIAAIHEKARHWDAAT